MNPNCGHAHTKERLGKQKEGFEATLDKASKALTKCHQELQAATDARNSKIEEARGLREAIRKNAERIEK